MKVALLGLKGDFEKGTGSGIKNYMYYLYESLSKSNIKVDKIEFQKSRFLQGFPWLNNWLSFGFGTLAKRFDGYDIVHNPDPGHEIFMRRGKYKLITTVHDFREFFDSKAKISSKDDIKQRIFVTLVKKALLAALKSDYLIARSTQTRDEAITLGFDKNKIFVSPSGLNKEFISRSIQKRNVNISILKVGYIGGFNYSKNLIFAIGAFKHIKNNNIHFLIYGKKALEYENLLKYSAGVKSIKFMGFAPEDKLVSIYDSFDAFVFPSLYEGLGLPIREAQSRGLPVIIYKYGKIPKEVRKYCFEAESPEHMAQIIENLKENGYNEKLRKKAIAYAKSFTWGSTHKETLDIYKKITA